MGFEESYGLFHLPQIYAFSGDTQTLEIVVRGDPKITVTPVE